MRIYWLAALCLMTVLGTADAQSGARFKINSVAVGFPAGPFKRSVDNDGRVLPLYKAGHWAPIFVEVECLGRVDGKLELVVETPDSESLLNAYRVPVPAMAPGDKVTEIQWPYLPYIRPGSSLPPIKVSLVDANGRPVCQSFTTEPAGSEPEQFHILTAGPPLPALRLPKPKEGNNQDEEASKQEFGKIEVAAVTTVRMLPDRWIGYDSIDVMILTTGSDEGQFAQELFSPENRARANALREWVRRGGKLIVTVGSNADIVAGIPGLVEMFPSPLNAGTRQNQPTLKLIWDPRGQQREIQTLRGSPLMFNTWAPKEDRPSVVLMKIDENAPSAGQALIRMGAYGMGRVTVVGFDVEKPTFTDYKNPEPFWKWLITESAGRLPLGNERQAPNRNQTYRSYNSEDANFDSQLNRLQGTLDFFEGVPVVSFGWVALFILIYILIIGPLDYYILKKVLKRMELTWITFPIVVLTISAIAYFTAYSMKGKDLRINKIDLVDIDLQTNRCYGQTWFTVFSPRIQSYQVTVEPNSGGWTADTIDAKMANVTMTWLGEARNERGSMFRRSYVNRVDVSQTEDKQQFASGLENVPIQVWSTKAFSATWATNFDPEKPLVVSTLRLANARAEQPDGSITLNLPIEKLDNVQLLYRDNAYDLGTLISGNPKRFVANGTSATKWMQNDFPAGSSDSQATRYARQNNGPVAYRLWGAMFHDMLDTSSSFTNASMRKLDQSWRVSKENAGQAVLIGRIPTSAGQAEDLMKPDQSPTRLWLTELPGANVERTPIPGTLRQETYIRVMIPIR